MSLTVEVVVLPLEKMDTTWGRIFAAGPDSAGDALVVAYRALGVNEQKVYADDERMTDVLDAWEEGDIERCKSGIAELDQELATGFASVAYTPDSGKFAWLVYEALLRVSEIREPEGVTSEQWIAAFRGLDQGRLDAVRAEVAEYTDAWDEAFSELKELKRIAQYAHEHAEKMAVFSMGDAIEQYPFNTRAEMLYNKLQEFWKK